MGGDKYHYCFEYTVSLNTDMRGTWTRELLDYHKNETLWWALKPEHWSAEGDKLHVHGVLVYEIQDASDSKHSGARTGPAVKKTILRRCKELATYIASNGNKSSLEVSPCYSDQFISSYMQKEGQLKYLNLPMELSELRPYFSELQLAKPKNPGYEKWADMYKEEEWPLPCTPATAWDFFMHHFHIADDIKSVSQIELKNRCQQLPTRVNKELPPNPYVTGPKKSKLHHPGAIYTASEASDRQCNREDCSEPVLSPRKQLCRGCRGLDPATGKPIPKHVLDAYA